jgi:uncharacterized membrane protein YbaN (DUF454 family)
MWLVLGWICVVLAAIGLALPLMPTVPFVIAAAFCFERGSPKLHAWLIGHPRFGPPLLDWQRHRVIRWPAKLLAGGGLLVSCSYTVIWTDRPEWVKWTVVVIGGLAIIFILSRRSRPRGI